jgi:tetratricopeptide (TPR) repeat protein
MRLSGLLAALALVASGAALAQDWKGLGRLEGQVVDSSGKPVPNATVKLDLPERGGGPTLKTDAKGRWAELGVVAGAWNIDIDAPGYVPKKITVRLPAEAARLAPIKVVLEKPAGPPPELVEAIKSAEQAYKEGRFAEARAGYEKLLATRPDLAATIHQQIGFSYIQEKQPEKAVEHLEKAVAADPANMQLRAIAAQAAFEGGLIEKGRALLAGLDETAIASPDVFFNMGVNLLNARQTEDAIALFTKAIARDQGYVDGYYQRAIAYLQLGKTAECRADMKRVVELAPGTPQAANAQKLLEQVK